MCTSTHAHTCTWNGCISFFLLWACLRQFTVRVLAVVRCDCSQCLCLATGLEFISPSCCSMSLAVLAGLIVQRPDAAWQYVCVPHPTWHA